MRQLTYKDTPDAPQGFEIGWNITHYTVSTEKNPWVVTGRITLPVLDLSFDGIGVGETHQEAAGRAFADALNMSNMIPVRKATVGKPDDETETTEEKRDDADVS
jgi:hypothetical protein